MSDSIYWCVFQARHPADKHKSDEAARWWPEWHQYHRDPSSNLIIYGDRVLFPPHQTPNPSKYIEWSETLPLDGLNSARLVGPFDFEPLSAFNRVRRIVGHQHWDDLTQHCSTLGLTPPTLGSTSSNLPSKPRKSLKRKARTGGQV